jgi:N-carbamoylputrescine amidase
VRVTVCELPYQPSALADAWAGLCRHTARSRSELVLLPEFALVDAVWEEQRFDPARWAAAVAESDLALARLPELRADHVVGTRAVTIQGRRYDEGYCWSAAGGLTPLRRKRYLPDEPGCWEARWFDRGDPDFPAYRAGALTFGLNICTELWALETYAAYAAMGVSAVLSPRATEAATAARWQSVGVVAAVRSGAFCLSSNRVDPTGATGGGGWIIGPDGRTLALTSAETPCATVDLDLAAWARDRTDYPRYVLDGEGELTTTTTRENRAAP